MTVNVTDSKPVAVGGEVLRRTDSHILSNSKANLTKSGDQHISPPKFNRAQNTTPDSDPRWGSTGILEEPVTPKEWDDTEVWDELEGWKQI